MNSVSGAETGYCNNEDMDLLSMAKNRFVANGGNESHSVFQNLSGICICHGQTITVYVAFRGYLADQWFRGE